MQSILLQLIIVLVRGHGRLGGATAASIAIRTTVGFAARVKHTRSFLERRDNACFLYNFGNAGYAKDEESACHLGRGPKHDRGEGIEGVWGVAMLDSDIDSERCCNDSTKEVKETHGQQSGYIRKGGIGLCCRV